MKAGTERNLNMINCTCRKRQVSRRNLHLLIVFHTVPSICPLYQVSQRAKPVLLSVATMSREVGAPCLGGFQGIYWLRYYRLAWHSMRSSHCFDLFSLFGVAFTCISASYLILYHKEIFENLWVINELWLRSSFQALECPPWRRWRRGIEPWYPKIYRPPKTTLKINRVTMWIQFGHFCHAQRNWAAASFAAASRCPTCRSHF